MDKCEIIERLNKIAEHAVHTVGEEPFVMSLDDGIAVHEAIELLKKPEPEAVFEWKKEFKEYIESLDITRDEWKGIIEYIDELPSIQPKGTRLSTVCLLCKKPAVTFNTEDDIPYTNYSYCEDCLRKGLKLLREQKKNSQAQPERKTGHWILNRSGAYCCDKCMEPCATYVMMKPRDKFCKMCGADMRGEKDG